MFFLDGERGENTDCTFCGGIRVWKGALTQRRRNPGLASAARWPTTGIACGEKLTQNLVPANMLIKGHFLLSSLQF